MQSTRRTPCLQIFHLFVAVFMNSSFFFLPLLHHTPHQVPLGLSCIISPKSTALCDGITLHDGWIWAKAAVRTGYLANVLSRPCPGTIESEQEGERDRKKKENTTKKETWDPVGKSLLGSALEEGGRWICRVMSVIWSQSITLGQYGFFISLLLQLFFFFPPSSPPLSLSLSVSKQAGLTAMHSCTYSCASVHSRPSSLSAWLVTSGSLLPPLCCPVGSRERGVRGRPTQGHGTGCKALAKSNMALIVFAGWSPLVCFCLPCPRGFSSRLRHKFPHTHMRLFLRSDTHTVCWGGNCQFGDNTVGRAG